MPHENKKSSTKYLVMAWVLIVYTACFLVAPLFIRDIGWVWVFYGLIPSSCAIGFALHSYYKSAHFERHSDRYLHQIADDMSAVKMYVQTIAGTTNEEFDQ